MTHLPELERMELSSSCPIHNLMRSAKRNLGCSILVTAIEDYISMDGQTHVSAAQFLFPADAAYQEHYEWVVSMAGGVNRTWLREALNSARPRWDKERQRKQLRAAFERQAEDRVSA